MQLKSKAEIQAAIGAARSQFGVSAPEGDDATAQVMLVCGPYAAVYGSVEAIAIPALITLALQLIPIIFGEGGFTIDKLTAILTLIQSIFA